MLTADLVNARRRGGELHIVALDGAARARATQIAEVLISNARFHVGRCREELLAALAAVDVGAREHRLVDGLVKLIEDRCEFDSGNAESPAEIRTEVFARASAARAALTVGMTFDRGAVLAEVARDRQTSTDAIERSLFADLRGAHVLTAFEPPTAAHLVLAYEQAQAQAVLLRAVKVTIDVNCFSAGALRVLFQRLKFLRLLHTVEREGAGHRIVIDGPFSLFESITKYGLQLALVLPALDACDSFRLEADVRWGKERLPLVFRHAGGTSTGSKQTVASPSLPDEAKTLLDGFRALDTEWKACVNTEILELPGIGLCVPDLVFEKRGPNRSRVRVYLEVMGYWSRAAVWRRVELVRAGLPECILFAVSSHLRVSEDVLDGELPGVLYVYKRTMSARTIEERLDALAREGKTCKSPNATPATRPKSGRSLP